MVPVRDHSFFLGIYFPKSCFSQKKNVRMLDYIALIPSIQDISTSLLFVLEPVFKKKMATTAYIQSTP